MIEQLRLDSRPAARSGAKEMKDLRAIPWVFSWTQSRRLISAWYGMGWALERFVQETPDIRAEYDRSVSMVLEVCQHDTLLADDPVMAQSIELRNPYVDPLNYLQIRFLPQWRSDFDSPARASLWRLLALTVAGISYGMKSTG